MSVENCFKTRGRVAVFFLVIAVCLSVITAAIAITVWALRTDTCTDKSNVVEVADNSPSADEVQWPEVDDKQKHEYRYATVATAEKNCSQIGIQMLGEGGSAVDAMIAASLCLGVSRSISSGIGGGGFMTFYQRSTNQTVVLDYRETAPAVATSDMYLNGTLSPVLGGGSMATPGEVAGLWEAHQRFGKLSWSRLFQPAIKLAEEGVTINDYIETSLRKNYHLFNDDLKAMYTNSDTGEMKVAGDTVTNTKLAQTYRRIAAGGAHTFYNGSLKDDIIADLREFDVQTVMEEDLLNYRVTEREPISSSLSNGGFTIVSPPPPSGGVVLQYILNILDGYDLTKESVSSKHADIETTSTTYHRIVEAFKFAYAKRMDLGDSSFVNVSEIVRNMTDKDHAGETRTKIMDDTTNNITYYGVTTDPRITTGTSQISIIAGNGDALSATTSVNFAWGSKFIGKRTGIIFNNLMDDFSMPDKPSWTDDAWTAPSNEANWIQPGKRPLSSMSPTIVLDSDGNVRLVTGGSGGSKIITAAAMTIINSLWFDMDLPEAVSRPRLHHQLLPEKILFDEGFPQVYLDELMKRNHDIEFNASPPVSDSVAADYHMVYGFGDPRRLGAADGF